MCQAEAIGGGYVALGMGLCILASVGSTFGLLMQKYAHVQQAALPEDEKYAESGSAILSPMWISGLLLLVAVPFPLDLVAFALAPQSLVVPLTGVTLVLNQVFAPWMLKEKVTKLDWIATAAIVAGIICATSFGNHCSYTYTTSQMVSLFQAPAFYVSEMLYAILALVLVWWLAHGAQYVYAEQESLNQSRAIAFGILAGTIGGQQQIFLKASGELLESTFDGRGDWNRPEPFLIMVACALLAVGQIVLLNKGMVLWTAVKYLPVYNVSLIICSTTYGSIFYEEYIELDSLQIVMFTLGVSVVVAGALLLTLKRDSVQSTVTPEQLDQEPKDLQTLKQMIQQQRQGHSRTDSEIDSNPMICEGKVSDLPIECVPSPEQECSLTVATPVHEQAQEESLEAKCLPPVKASKNGSLPPVQLPHTLNPQHASLT